MSGMQLPVFVDSYHQPLESVMSTPMVARIKSLFPATELPVNLRLPLERLGAAYAPAPKGRNVGFHVAKLLVGESLTRSVVAMLLTVHVLPLPEVSVPTDAAVLVPMSGKWNPLVQ